MGCSKLAARAMQHLAVVAPDAASLPVSDAEVASEAEAAAIDDLESDEAV